jgi:hypothetical protein
MVGIDIRTREGYRMRSPTARFATSFVLFALISIVPPEHAGATPVEFSFLGIRTYTLFGFLPAPTGGDIALTFGGGTPAVLPVSILLSAGGGYEREDVFRTADGGDLSVVTADDDTTIDRLEITVEPAVVARLTSAAPVDLSLAFRSSFRADFGTESAIFASESYFPDAGRLLLNSIRAGIRYDAADLHATHHSRRGIDTGVTVEWSPSFLGNRVAGDADFLRANASGRIYFPLFDLAPDRELNLLSAYFANQTIVDVMTGNAIPFSEQARTGGFHASSGLGGLIRGFDWSEKSALFKIANNAEVRLVGPALGIASLVPVLSLFLDTGYYAGFRTGGYFRPSVDGEAGALVSAGGTLSINLFGVIYLGYLVAVPLVGERADGEATGMKVAMSLHF